MVKHVEDYPTAHLDPWDMHLKVWFTTRRVQLDDHYRSNKDNVKNSLAQYLVRSLAISTAVVEEAASHRSTLTAMAAELVRIDGVHAQRLLSTTEERDGVVSNEQNDQAEACATTEEKVAKDLLARETKDAEDLLASQTEAASAADEKALELFRIAKQAFASSAQAAEDLARTQASTARSLLELQSKTRKKLVKRQARDAENIQRHNAAALLVLAHPPNSTL